MNSLFLLLLDEFKGFAKSKIIITLWIGLPIVSIIYHFLTPVTGDFPVSLFLGIIIASIGGLLAAVMLSSAMVNELGANVYDLYLIRPVSNWQPWCPSRDYNSHQGYCLRHNCGVEYSFHA